jgi:cysteine-rich repeat protein
MTFRSLWLLGLTAGLACPLADLPPLPNAGIGNARCGDGALDSGEQCDDGNRSNNDDCTNECSTAACGDGFVLSGVEACDDGNEIQSDGCQTGCALSRCGDGILRTDVPAGDNRFEACDDGDGDDANGCTNACRLATCGDGFLRSDAPAGSAEYEACDDGNQIETDGCLRDCTISRCGDGIRAIVSPGSQALCGAGAEFPLCQIAEETCFAGRCVSPRYEECDDGNGSDLDECTNACRNAFCGDGILRADLAVGEAGYEVCDDGNTNPLDACTGDCAAAVCGDRVVRADIPRGTGRLCGEGQPDCPLEEACRDGICLTPLYEACDDDDDPNDECQNCLWLGSTPDNTLGSCQELFAAGVTADGDYWIDPEDVNQPAEFIGHIVAGSRIPDTVYSDGPLRVRCNMTTDGGGWTMMIGADPPDDLCRFWTVGKTSFYRYDPDLWGGDYFDTGPVDLGLGPVYQCGSSVRAGGSFEGLGGISWNHVSLWLHGPIQFSELRYLGDFDNFEGVYRVPSDTTRLAGSVPLPISPELDCGNEVDQRSDQLNFGGQDNEAEWTVDVPEPASYCPGLEYRRSITLTEVWVR